MSAQPNSALPETAAQPENFERFRQRRSASLLMSLLLHGCLLGLAVLLFSIFRSPTPDEPLRRGSIVLTSIDENQQEDFLTEEDIEETLDETAVAAAAAAAAAETAPAIDMPVVESLPGPPPIEPTPNATEMVNESHTDAATHQFELSEAELAEIAREQRRLKSRQPKGDPMSINVFDGTNMTGRRFVFIIDRSRSMGSQGLGVLARAQTELSSAIQQLKPNHEFQIVAYHSRTVTISKRQLLPATDSNKALVKPFLQNLAAFGATEHNYGINAGLAFRPDAIVLLTDGGYPGLTASQLKLIRRVAGNAEFHCIQFGLGTQQESSNFMMRLASECNGTFRYIDVRDWDE
ncbi:vWA domain-containing protein [Mariniblastus fucicola]|uniref:VWFA domain-containing protein n=1 Tax=Mariniblastus fucicola TaxID=980251 RepID=A0A5B9PCI2_9BACT|nr:VWA domain-containing protein [Mariniblastus fucicola]QEG20821.1 hypothetical protein MFFC18_06720 [Mariniblastus fucicola]